MKYTASPSSNHSLLNPSPTGHDWSCTRNPAASTWGSVTQIYSDMRNQILDVRYSDIRYSAGRNLDQIVVIFC